MRDEIGPVTTPVEASAAGGCLGLAGLLTTAAMAQLFLVVHLTGWQVAVPWALGALGVAAMPVGGTLSRARPRAAAAGVVLAVLLAGGTGSWLVYTGLRGFFSPLALFAAGASILAALAVPLSLPATLRTARARAKLMDDGS